MGEQNNSMSYISPDDYVSKQPEARQAALTSLRQALMSHLPSGFEEVIQYNMITYVVPLSLYPKGYHCNPSDPLPFISLANQKGFIALYHMGIYADNELLKWFTEQYAALDIGKLDMGKSCIRFKKLDRIPYDLISALAAKISPEVYIQLYESAFRKV